MKVRILTLALGLGSACFAGAQVFTDDFNRADSSSLGANWTQTSATTQIANNMAVNGQSTPGMAIVNGFSAAYTVQSVSMDVSLTNANLGYVGGVLGYGSDDIFVKVQGSGGTFTNYGFYHANNSSGVSGGGFFSLNTTFTSARITVSVLSNDSVQLGIDTDFNGSFDQTYTATGYSAYSLGTGAGIALYGSGAGDNYRAQGIVPEPASFAVLGLGALALLRRRRSRK